MPGRGRDDPWQVHAAPADCPGLAWAVAGLHLCVAGLPWLAGSESWVSLGLSTVALAALPGALRAVPGRFSALRCLRRKADGSWVVGLKDGSEAAAGAVTVARVLPGVVLCRLQPAGKPLDCWIPRHSLPAGTFRRLKVAMRCGPPVGVG